MDFGSLVCKPRNPECNNCCIVNSCGAYKRNLTNVIPIKNKKNSLAKPIKYANAYVISNKKNKILLGRRSSKGLLPLMLEVPTSEWLNRPLKNKDTIKYSPIKIKYRKVNKNIIYSFSHFKLNINIFTALTERKLLKNLRWYSTNNINSLGLPTVMKKILRSSLPNI
tara:strand:- start:916 stop:1416 length:501 start_codon:yes stop_codon:yes gene_type:complete